MNSIENIKDQKPKEVTEAHRAWLTAAPLGQLYSAYRGLVAHVVAQMRYALEEHESGEPIHSTRRAHAIMLEYPERLRLVSAEIARRVGSISSANVNDQAPGLSRLPASACFGLVEGGKIK